MSRQPPSLKVRALQWLAQREHSPDELRGKLLRLSGRTALAQAQGGPEFDLERGDDRASSEREVDALLEWLVAHGYLSSARFAESRVHARQQRYGNLRIQQELRRHRVGLDAQTQQALQGSELDRARQVWQRKFGAPAEDAAGRARQARFLAGRGFSSDAIRCVVRGTPSRGGADDNPGELLEER